LAVWEQRAHRARRDIAALAAAGLGVSELHAAAIHVISDVVSAELTCWAVIDPETLVISTMVSGENRIPPEYEPWLVEAEYSADEPHTFATLALRKQTVARLSDLPDTERDRSARFNKCGGRWDWIGNFACSSRLTGCAGAQRAWCGAATTSLTARRSSSPRSAQPSLRRPGWRCGRRRAAGP
jgi:hypothetical protein